MTSKSITRTENMPRGQNQEIKALPYQDVYRRTSPDEAGHAYLNTEHVAEDYRQQVVRPWLESLHSRLGKPLTILDLASGSGEFAKHVDNENNRVVSVDISAIGLKLAPKGMKARANFLQLPFQKGNFDAIHCKDAVAHVAQLDTFFKEISRVLKIDGELILVGVPVKESFHQAMGEDQVISYHAYPWHFIEETALHHNLIQVQHTTWQQGDQKDWYEKSPGLREVQIFRKVKKIPFYKKLKLIVRNAGFEAMEQIGMK